MQKGFSLLMLVLALFSCGGGENTITPNVVDELKDSSAYVTQMFEFVYAPGQQAASAYSASPENIVGKPNYLYTVAPVTSEMPISLGGWGGYIVTGFNHTIANGTGADIIVLCGSSPSPEPAVVFVMQDVNANGLPDDTWYELKGSEYENVNTIRDYQVTYTKPTTDNSYVTWQDNKSNADSLKSGFGSVFTNSWWKYPALSTQTFSGTLLPDAYYNESPTSTPSWVVYPNLFTWGYAENSKGTDYNNSLKGNELDISNAVDANGNTVNLSSIRFVKIQSAVFQQAGWINDISPEIFGIGDLGMMR